MMAATHATFATASFWLVLSSVGLSPLESDGESVRLLATAAAGSLFPDIDEPGSYIGRRLWPLAWPLHILVGHREATHSFLFVLLLYAALSLLFLLYDIPHAYAAAFAAGNLLHIAADMMTKGGCPVLLPFTVRRYRLLPKPLCVRTGGAGEHLLLILLAAGLAYVGADKLGVT